MERILFIGKLEPESISFLRESMVEIGIPYSVSSFTMDINVNRPFILLEVSKMRPTVVICLGSAATRLFGTFEDDRITAVRKMQFSCAGTPVHTTYNPAYIMKTGGNRSREFKTWVADIRAFFNQHSANYEEKSAPLTVYTVNQYVEFISAYSRTPRLALDYEASSLTPLLCGFHLAGIGLSDGTTSGYLTIRDYGNPHGDLPPEVRDKLGRFLKYLNNNRRLLAFNISYEYKATLGAFGVHLDKLLDVLQMGRTIDTRGGLKEQSELLLGVRGWTKEVDLWIENMKYVLRLFSPTYTAKGPKDRAEYVVLAKEGIAAALDKLLSKDLKSTSKAKESVEYLLEASTPLYGGREAALAKLEHWLLAKGDAGDWEGRYTDIPVEITAPYCAQDCYNTVRLDDYYTTKLQEQNLQQAYKYYNEQMYFGIRGSCTGFRWDDEYVEGVKRQYLGVATGALRNFLLTNRAKSVLGLDVVKEMLVLSAKDMDSLKAVFNPNNTQAENTAKLSEVLCSDSVRLAMMFAYLSSEYYSGEIHAVECPLLVKLLLNYAKGIPNYPQLVSQAIIRANVQDMLTPNERALLVKFSQYQLPDAAAGTIEAVANAAAKYLGVDLDDENTWTDDYRCIFYFKLFKKADKGVSAFCDGVNGRKAVYVTPVNHPDTHLSVYRPLGEADVDMSKLQELVSKYSLSEINEMVGAAQ